MNAAFGLKALVGDYIVAEASLTRTLNEAGSFDFNIPVSLLRGQSFHLLGTGFQDVYSAELYQDGNLLIQGNVDSIDLNYVDEDLSFKFSCNGELTDLTRYFAKSTAYFQDEYVLQILTQLFTPDVGSWLALWEFGELFTMEDVLIKTTIDLRGETHLSGQILKTLSAIPNTFFRYGGYTAGFASPYASKFRLDIGVFNRQIYPAISAESVLELSQSVKYSGVLRLIRSYGGEIEVAGVKRRIDLQDAVAYDPDLASLITQQYPITSFGLLNANIFRGYGEEVVQYYDEIVPSVKVNPSALEIAQAGYALYLKTKNKLIQKSTFQNNWNATVKELPDDFKLGDQVFLRGTARQIFYDQHSGKSLYVDLGTVAQWYRVNSYTQKIKNNSITYVLDLATTLRLQEKSDPILDLYDSISQPTKAEDSVYVSPGWVYDLLSVTIPTGVEGDSFNGEPGDYYPAALYIIPLGTIPPGVTSVTLVREPFSYDGNVEIGILSNPSLPSNGVQVTVSVNRNWTIDDSVTVYALVVYKP